MTREPEATEPTTDADVYGDYSVDAEDQLDPADTLEDDDVDDELDRGYSPPERYSPAQRHGTTAREAEEGEGLDARLAQEEPEPDPYADPGAEVDEQLSDYAPEVGDTRAGRLVDPDAGFGEDTEDELIGDDVGIDGAAASAEEAAVHVIED